MEQKILDKIEKQVKKASLKARAFDKEFSRRFHLGGITNEIRSFCQTNNIEYTDELNKEVINHIKKEMDKYDQSGEEKISVKESRPEKLERPEEDNEDEDIDIKPETAPKFEAPKEEPQKEEEPEEEQEEEPEKPNEVISAFNKVLKNQEEMKKAIEEYYLGFPTDLSEELDNFFFLLESFKIYFLEQRLPNQSVYENLKESFETIVELSKSEYNKKVKKKCEHLITSFYRFKIMFDKVLQQYLMGET